MPSTWTALPVRLEAVCAGLNCRTRGLHAENLHANRGNIWQRLPNGTAGSMGYNFRTCHQTW